LQIAVNTRLLIPNKLDGIGWFTYQTLKRITKNNPETHFIFLFDRNYSEEFIFSDNITPIVIGPQARHPFLYYLWFNYSVKNLLNKLKPDLFLSPDGFLTMGSKCKQLPVFHDINFFHNPKNLKPLTSRYYNYYFPKYAQIATRIATVSEYSKADICKNYNINYNKIDVVYNGINEGFKEISEEEKQAVKNKYSQGKSFFLFVGSQSPRKNLNRLIFAFENFKQQTKSDFKLLLVGSENQGESETKKIYEKSIYKSDIIFTGRVAQFDLEKIMASAFALTFIPYFEGFGIPLIEAMQCSIPIICSNTSSMPEIVSDSALLVNPFEVQDISNAMVNLFQNPSLQKQLVEKGHARKENFSWEKTSDLLWKSIEKTL
jgi:glycosyltransferase involved in cell wall biosynthesis